MRNRTLQSWLGRLMVTAMLFTPSALLWAQTVSHAQSDQHMQQSCHDHAAMTPDAGQHHSRHNQCHHNHGCNSQCLSTCVYAGSSVLPATMVGVLPYFQTSDIQSVLLLSPDGTHRAVLDRPPRNLS